MYCSNCGKLVADDAKFCTNCGTPIKVRMQPTQRQSTPPTQPPQKQSTQPTQQQSTQQKMVETPARPQPARQTVNAQAAATPAAATPAAVTQPAVTPRDSRGKYILKRLLFFGIALVIAIGSAFLLRVAFPHIGGNMMRGTSRVLSGTGATAFILIVGLIVSFIIGMLGGLAKGNTGKNVVRIISVILRAFVPMSLGYILIEAFSVQTRLLPMRSDAMVGMLMPMLTMILPLAGFLMNAAVSNGHRTTFAQGIGAVAAWIADHIVIIVLFEVIVEWIFQVPGLGYLTQRTIMNMDIGLLFASVLALMILILLFKLINDIIAALAAGGDPTEQVFGTCGKIRAAGTQPLTADQIKQNKSGKVLLIIGIICAGLIIVIALIMAFTSTYAPEQMDMNGILLAPGQGDHILGTDRMGRDIYALLASGVFYTIFAALTNTIIAIILGVGFGVLAGFLRGAGAEVFKAIRYIFGFGAPLAIMILIMLDMLGNFLPLMFLPGLFGWGGIADRLAGAIKAKKAHPGEQTSLILPVLEQVVHTFCIAIIGITIMGMSGMLSYHPHVLTLGTLLSSSRDYLISYPFLAVAPAFALTIILAAFYLLHAGLSARERYLK